MTTIHIAFVLAMLDIFNPIQFDLILIVRKCHQTT